MKRQLFNQRHGSQLGLKSIWSKKKLEFKIKHNYSNV